MPKFGAQHRVALLVFLWLASTGSAIAAETKPASGHAAGASHESLHWGYGQNDGPAQWARLNPKFALCAEGREQSPIDLSNAKPVDHARGVLDYRATSLKIIRQEHAVEVTDNGHTIQINYDEGSVLKLGTKTYALKQYHFHAPSEHTVDGQSFPMEMHLVHQSAAGELAVLGVLIKVGAHNPAFAPVWAHLPSKSGEKVHLEHVRINVDDLLPARDHGFRYRGSLTTPPCSEGVTWIVAFQQIELSAEQIAAFTAIFNGNNRPVQPLGKRLITIDRISER